jgi:hypothetical protein
MIVTRLGVRRRAAVVITGLGAGGGRCRRGGRRPVVAVVVGEAGGLGLAGHRNRDLVAEGRVPGYPGDGGCGCDAPVATTAARISSIRFM